MLRAPVLYLETSVFGFFADEEPRNLVHSEAVRALFQQIELGILDGITSRVTADELGDAPAELREGLLRLLALVRVPSLDEVEVARLAARYVKDGIIPAQYIVDAQHVACATLARADVLVSMNLKHIANEWSARRVNAVNMAEGYPLISVRTPMEVLRYET
ncbi:MAG: hypothetical protein R6X13_12070 [bacterium]